MKITWKVQVVGGQKGKGGVGMCKRARRVLYRLRKLRAAIEGRS